MLFISEPATSDESEPPFSQLPDKENLLVFERAGLAADLDHWLLAADLQLTDLPEWEREYWLEEWEERLLLWLRHEWADSLPQPRLDLFINEIEKAHEAYVFATNDSGRILRDARGNPLVLERGGDAEDFQAWQQRLGTRMEELLQQWEQESQVVYHELLSALNTTESGKVQSAARMTLAQYKEEVHREFERLYRQAESQFIRVRLKQTSQATVEQEMETPEKLARLLITRTQAELQDSGIRSDTGSEAFPEHTQAPIVLDAQTWKEDFYQTFKQGIEAWNRAEQSFLDERIRWETDARTSFAESEEAWRTASFEFQQARESWIGDMQRRLDEGLAWWDQLESEFIDQYDLVMTQLAAASKGELDQLDQELGRLLGLYSQNSNLLEVAKANIELLQGEITTLEEQNDPDRLDSLLLLREELLYWQGENGKGGVLGQCRQACDQVLVSLVDLEARIRVYGLDGQPYSCLQREIARLEDELTYLAEQLDLSRTADPPPGITSQQKQAYRRITTVLDVLRSLDADSQRLDPLTRLDSGYLELKDRELSQLNAWQHLLFASDLLKGSIEELELGLGSRTAELIKSIGDVFAFFRDSEGESIQTLSYTPSFECLDPESLTDFSAVEDSLFADAVADYFAGEEAEVSEKLSHDVTIWLTAMAGLDGDCEATLRAFGLAYYYDVKVQNDLNLEASPEIDVTILHNPNFTVLVDEYLELGPVTLPLFVWGESGPELMTVYPEDRLVPEDYLEKITGHVLNDLQSDPYTTRLYAFFKAMLATGHFVPGVDFICDDLGDLAYNYVEDKARDLQHDWETKWWLFKWRKADEIQSLRNKIAHLHVTGVEERGVIASWAVETTQAQADILDLNGRLEFLVGQGTDGSSFESALEQLTEVSVNDALSTIIDEAFDRMDPVQSSGTLAVLQAVQSLLAEDLTQTRLAISAAISGLFADHQEKLASYLKCLYDPDTNEQDLIEAVRELYFSPGSSFFVDDYHDAELIYAKSIEALTPEGQSQRLSKIAIDLYGLMEHRLGLCQEQAQQDLQLQLRQLLEQRSAWEAGIENLLAAGLQEWAAGTKEITDSHEQWVREFLNEYNEKLQLWEGKYILLERNREGWIERSTQNAVTTATKSVALQMKLDADRLIAETQTISIPRMISGPANVKRIVQEALPGAALDDVLKDALSVGYILKPVDLEAAIYLPGLCSSSSYDRFAKQLANAIGEEIFSRVALVSALHMRRLVEQAEDEIIANIVEANRSMEENLSDMLQGSGYRRSGLEYTRASVIDKTLFGGLEEEVQTVQAYRYFVAPDFDSGVDLSRASLEGRSGDYIQEMAAQAQENLKKYMELIFGRSENRRENWDWKGINGEFKAYFDSQTVSFQGAEGFHRKDGLFHDVDGLFPYHIGYEPVMKQDAPEEVQEPGYGQLGLIMAAYFRNEARQARGLSMLEIPWYNLRMWDDDADNDGEADGWLEAPSARSAVDLAVSIAATATGNVWVAASVNLIDDAAFTMADITSGYIDLEEGVLSFGKQALIGMATVGTGASFDALDGALGAFAEGGVCKTLLQGVESATNRVVGATVNAVGFDSQGELMFNAAQYKETLIGQQALRGYLAEVSGFAVGDIIEGNLTGFSGAHIRDVQSISRLAGGLTQASLEYVLTGQTILNLADFSMFGLEANQRTLSGGFSELHLGQEQPHFALGQQGPDMSLTALADVASGFDTWIESLRIRRYDLLGEWETAEDYKDYRSVGTSMRSLYSYGDVEGQELYEELLGGQTRLLVGFSNAKGQTELLNDVKQVHVATLGDYWDRNSRLASGVVLQHEAHRDGLTVDALAQQLETRSAVRSHTDMALKIAEDYGCSFIEADRSLLRDVVASRLAEAIGPEFFSAYVDNVYESEKGDLYSIERWSGTAIGTTRRKSSYYVMKLEQDPGDASIYTIRNTVGPAVSLFDRLHNLFSNKDRVEMSKPLFDIVGREDYFGALKVLYGKGADVIGAGADVIGLIDDIITGYEIVRNVKVPGSGAVGGVSNTLEIIDGLIVGIASGANAVIEKEFADYWWESGVPNFATTQSDLEDLTHFMFKQFADGTRIEYVARKYEDYVSEHQSLILKHYNIFPEWKIRIDSFGSKFIDKPYLTPDGIGTTNGYEEYLWSHEDWKQFNAWWAEYRKYWDN